MKRYSDTLNTKDGLVFCAKCQNSVGKMSDWKELAPRIEINLSELPGAGSQTLSELVLRQFACATCGHLLDSEMALPGESVMNDLVRS